MKLTSLLTAAVIVMSLTTSVFAGDNFTVKNSTTKLKEDFCSINVSSPYFDGFKGADEINKKIGNMVADSIGQARTTANYMKDLNDEFVKKGERPIATSISLDTSYDYIRSGDILSLQFNTYYYAGGAHPINWVTAFTANTTSGEIYTLKTLFKENSDYAELITNKIIEAINKNSSYYFKDYAKTISGKNGDFNFYIDGNNLVIYFGLYEIAPYAAGIERFVFSAEDLKTILKDEVYNSIKDAKPLGAVRFNGQEVQTQSKSYISNGSIMVPLRAVAETLGYTVDWNENDGAIVDGGFIKENVNSYRKTGKEPISLVAPVENEGVIYVPVQYFTRVLEENVSYGQYKLTYTSDTAKKDLSESVIRINSKTGYENLFNKLVIDYKQPVKETDCINMYAEAVKYRNGAVQYALLSSQLREEQYQYFKDLNFVTGVSSPWVDSYDISKIDENKYLITFHLKTSSPVSVPDTATIVTVEKNGDHYIISALESDNK